MRIDPRLPHTYSATQPTKQQAQKPPAAAEAPTPSAAQPPVVVTVSQTLSAETTQKLREQQEFTPYEAYLGATGQQLGMAGKQAGEEQNKLKILLTCMEIARRIRGGDNVPPADHAYLLKHDAALYARSVSLRLPKENPYQYKRLSEEEPCEISAETGFASAPCGDLAQILSGQAGGQATEPGGE